ncbi:hypothetical protein ACHAWC_010573 [Mediolabrus comicus]
MPPNPKTPQVHSQVNYPMVHFDMQLHARFPFSTSRLDVAASADSAAIPGREMCSLPTDPPSEVATMDDSPPTLS